MDQNISCRATLRRLVGLFGTFATITVIIALALIARIAPIVPAHEVRWKAIIDLYVVNFGLKATMIRLEGHTLESTPKWMS